MPLHELILAAVLGAAIVLVWGAIAVLLLLERKENR